MIAPEERIVAALARLGAEYEPPLGWQARVLAASRPRRAHRPWWSYVMPAAAVAAAAVCVLQFRAPPRALAVDVDVEHRVALRGSEAQVGDVARVTVSGGADHRALWVYRDEQRLVMSCPGDPGCAVSAAGITLAFELREVGNYTVVALSSGAALAAPSGSYDDDTAAARRAGATISEDRITVR